MEQDLSAAISALVEIAAKGGRGRELTARFGRLRAALFTLLNSVADRNSGWWPVLSAMRKMTRKSKGPDWLATPRGVEQAEIEVLKHIGELIKACRHDAAADARWMSLAGLLHQFVWQRSNHAMAQAREVKALTVSAALAEGGTRVQAKAKAKADDSTFRFSLAAYLVYAVGDACVVAGRDPQNGADEFMDDRTEPAEPVDLAEPTNRGSDEETPTKLLALCRREMNDRQYELMKFEAAGEDPADVYMARRFPERAGVLRARARKTGPDATADERAIAQLAAENPNAFESIKATIRRTRRECRMALGGVVTGEDGIKVDPDYLAHVLGNGSGTRSVNAAAKKFGISETNARQRIRAAAHELAAGAQALARKNFDSEKRHDGFGRRE